MNFAPDTIVADAIKTDPGVVDRLVALHPAFRRLRNPVLRRVMARLVTLRDAARVAGVPLAQVMATVNGQAYVPAENPDPEQEGEQPRPDWMDTFTGEKITRLDVRPMLAAGEEPLGRIMKDAAKVEEGGFLVIEAPFDPAPLRRVLARKGFVSYGKALASDHWQIVFLHDSGLAAAAAVEDENSASQWRDGATYHIDVRGLEPPKPMLAILALIESGDATGQIIVHHEREPVFLYPELAERGWRFELIDGEPGEVRLRLTPETGS